MKSLRTIVLPLVLALGAGVASAEGDDQELPPVDPAQDCIDGWADSDAADHCTATLTKRSVDLDESPGQCNVSAACSVDLDLNRVYIEDGSPVVDRERVTVSGSVSEVLPSHHLQYYTLCFAPRPYLDVFDLALRHRCLAGETVLDAALDDGLRIVDLTPEDDPA